mmetsp:Transcript_39486/g.86243  ORF Transcript_39486/g.86243 Transcript_39486/m.86243 type:complete len:240 (+) Transcript_39486:72-791(+)
MQRRLSRLLSRVAPGQEDHQNLLAFGPDGAQTVDSSGLPFETCPLTLSTLGGDSISMEGLSLESTLEELVLRSSEAFDFPATHVQLVLGPRAFLFSDSRSTLGALGILPGDEISVIRRPFPLLENVGTSAFNEDYHCQVLRVEEVAVGTLELDFVVVGNMSLGTLQDPEGSKLWRRSLKNDLKKPSNIRPSGSKYLHEDEEREIRGTLTYEDVDTRWPGTTFTFGTAGYHALKIPFPEC